MKHLCCVSLILLMGFVLTAFANPPAKTVIDPKQVAEDARFKGTLKNSREVLLELDALDQKFIDAWVELRQALEDNNTLDSVWGVQLRRAAEKRKASLDSLIPRLQLRFDKHYKKRKEKIDRELVKKKKVVEKLTSRPISSNERLNTIQAKELASAQAEESHYEGMLFAMENMVSCFSNYKKSSGGDRLSQIGIASHERTLRAEISEYSNIIDLAYDIKDLKTDIAALEDRKKEGKDWYSGDEGTLRVTRMKLEKTGKSIEDQVARVRKRLKQDIEKLQITMKRLDSRIEGAKSGSKSQDRYQTEKWDIESKLYAEEAKDEVFAAMGTWKE